MKSFITLISIMCFLLSTSAYSSQPAAEIEQIQVSMDELILSDQGIYLIEDGVLVEVSAVYSSAQGVTVVPNRDVQKGQINTVCGNGHDIYHHRHDGGCGGCANWWCVYRCKCNSP